MCGIKARKDEDRTPLGVRELAAAFVAEDKTVMLHVSEDGFACGLLR